jgi:hypothetical protein
MNCRLQFCTTLFVDAAIVVAPDTEKPAMALSPVLVLALSWQEMKTQADVPALVTVTEGPAVVRATGKPEVVVSEAATKADCATLRIPVKVALRSEALSFCPAVKLEIAIVRS